MKIRLATALDAPALARVENTQLLCAHWGEKGWQSEVVQASSRVWCAEENGEIIGFAALRLAAGLGEILNVAVRPEWTRRGIAFELLTRLVRYAQAQGAEQITLEVNIRNVAAISLYSKVGFVEIGRREKFYNNQEDALLLKKEL